MSFDLNNCSQDCFNCIKSYKKKHRLSGIEENPFKISCSGIPQNYVSKDLYQILPEEQVKTAEIMLDPVAWAREVLDWHCLDPDGEVWKRKNPEEYYDWIKKHPGEDILGYSRYHRFYQALMLRCNSQFKAFRIGRRAGKTESLVISILYNLFVKPGIAQEDGFKTIVIAPYQEQIDGIFKRIEQLVRSNRATENAIKRYVKSPSYRLELYNNSMVKGLTAGTKSGGNAASVRGSDANQLVFDECFMAGTRIQTNVGAKNIEDIMPGDIVTSFSKLDGSLSFNKVIHTQNTGVKDVKRYILENKDTLECTTNHPVWNGESFCDIEKQDALYLSDSLDPMSVDIVEASLYGFILSDGWARYNKRGAKIIGFSGSIEGLKDIKRDLAFLNLDYTGSNIYSRETYSPKYGIRGKTNSFTVGREIWDKLFKFEFPVGRKPEQSYLISSIILNSPTSAKRAFLATLFGCEGTSPCAQVNRKTIRPITLSFTKVSNLEKNLIEFMEQIKDLLSDVGIDSYYYKYKGKIATPNRIKYMLSIKNNKSNMIKFFNDISFRYEPEKKRLAFLWKHFLKTYFCTRGRNYEVPTFDNFVKDHIVDDLLKIDIVKREYIGRYETYNLSVENNNTYISNDVIVHNCDYLAQEDINAALAVTIDHPNATVWMSSTPSGARGKFFENCNSRLYREFHFPSSVNPMWNEATEAFQKEGMTEMAYKHEILAEWGSQEEGVFQNTYVEAAQAEYQYGQIARSANWIYMLGVDWNDVKIGTSIAVVGFNIAEQIFYLLAKEKVSREGWTQTAACQKIAQLNQFWNPKAIYIDEGYGSTQREMLHKYGWDSLRTKGADHPDSRLRNIVKSYAFGRTIEIHDLITKQPIKKPAKPFLVENTVRKFEHNVIRYPRSDENFTKQLLGYVIDRVNQSGTPVYKAMDKTVGDHDLDAVMLAMVGFTLETTDFGQPKYSIDFTFSGKIGEKIDVEESSQGWIAKQDKKRMNENSKHRPDLKRTEDFEEDKKPILSSSQGLPARHTTRDTDGIKLWTWPGFMRDEPKPTSSVRGVRNGMAVRTMKPKRKNI